MKLNARKIPVGILLILLFGVFTLAQEKLVCPTSISVTDPAGPVTRGENVKFTAYVTGKVEYKNIGYVWSIDNGEIVKGQGTPTITVSTKGNAETHVNTTVTLTGLPEACAKSASGSLYHYDPPFPKLFDEIGEVSTQDLKKRIGVYFRYLRTDANATGYIVIYGKRVDAEKQKKILYELLFGESREPETSRFVFVRGGEEVKLRTRLWIVPAGADASTILTVNNKVSSACPSSISVVDPPVAVVPGDDLTFIAQVVSEIPPDKIGYVWTVDVGKIIKGQGTPTIIVKRSDRGTTTTATVRITGLPKGCHNSVSGSGLVSAMERISCPNIQVDDPPFAVATGENMIFTAKIDNGMEWKNIRYVWKIDKGRIAEGQGTDSITVNTSGNVGVTINATVEFGGFPGGCDNRASGAGLVVDGGDPIFADEFGKINSKDIEERLQPYFDDIKGEPKVVGFVVNYGEKSDIAKRAKLVKKLMQKYKLDSSRIIFIDGGKESEIRTRLWIVPADTDPKIMN